MNFNTRGRVFFIVLTVIILMACCKPNHRFSSEISSDEDQQYISPNLSTASRFASSVLACYIDNEDAIGLTFAASYKGNIILSEGYGWADLEQKTPVNPNTRFRLASVSKLFMAAAIAKLSEQDMLNLDIPIQTYLPEFPEKQWPITTRQVAAHISGIRGYQAKDFVKGEDIHQRKFTSTTEALTIFSEDPLLFKPGTKYKYSTYGFTLLTALVENITKLPYEVYLRQEILSPLKIHSVVPDRPEQIISHRSRFYELSEDRIIEHASPIRSDFKFGGGGLLGTSEDLARFGAIHIKPGFFSSETLDENIFTQQKLANNRSINVGLAWRFGVDQQFGRVYHHSGALPGGRSILMVWPDHELVIALTSNTTNAPYYAEQFAQTMSHLFLTAISGVKLTSKNTDLLSKKLSFQGNTENAYHVLDVPSLPCSGSLQTPYHISKELEKRGYPVPFNLKVMDSYINQDDSLSVIIASDIGLHRLQLNSHDKLNTSGFMVELANKFKWNVTNHQFNIKALSTHSEPHIKK
ncbi:serine hydrolase domain-containing protein [Marinicella sp. W31]|uniref:serine hydrolase domain-containing protein n=1 Tax=Marinicella sp. W31 TaxID=3023713 RepID=UPI0037574993